MGQLLLNNFNQKAIHLILFSIGFLGILTTFSITNSIVFFVSLLLLILFTFQKNVIKVISISIIGILLLLFFESQFHYLGTINYYFFGKNVVLSEMFFTGYSKTYEKMFSLIIGHNNLIQFSDISSYTEIAFIKIFSSLGLSSSILFILCILSPFMIYIRNIKTNTIIIPIELFSIFAGILSLVHYGSVLRSTNIFIFFVISSQVWARFCNKENKIVDKKLISI